MTACWTNAGNSAIQWMRLISVYRLALNHKLVSLALSHTLQYSYRYRVQFTYSTVSMLAGWGLTSVSVQRRSRLRGEDLESGILFGSK